MHFGCRVESFSCFERVYVMRINWQHYSNKTEKTEMEDIKRKNVFFNLVTKGHRGNVNVEKCVDFVV